MLRYLRLLPSDSLALDRSMIPLGSCTMKLNAAAEMEPVSWPEVAGMHLFALAAQAGGYLELIESLELRLARLTGYDAVSVQLNAGPPGRESQPCWRSGATTPRAASTTATSA